VSAFLPADSFTRSEEAASGSGKRARNRECSGKSFHSATSLRRKRVLASESSRARGEFATLAITCHEFFSRSSSGCHGAVQRWGHNFKPTQHTRTSFGRLGEGTKARVGRLGKFSGAPAHFAIYYSFYFEIAAGRGLPALPFWRGRHSVRAEHNSLVVLPHKCNANCFADSPADSYLCT
jgi:hypothetical protein